LKEFARRVLDEAVRGGATYADIRVVDRRTEHVRAKNSALESISDNGSKGWGVRVLSSGGWGFASTYDFSPEAVDRVTRQALSIAEASAAIRKKPVELAPAPVVQDSYHGLCEEGPFDVPLEEKVATLLEATGAARATSDEIRVATASMENFREDKLFASTEGSWIDQHIVETAATLQVMAMRSGEVQRRTYPNSIFGDTGQRGYEHIRSQRLVETAPALAKEAVDLLDARSCPAGEATIILEPSQLALQLHESAGHPMELDRVFGHEADYAGTSFLTTDKMGSYQYGSPQVNITADATIPGARGTFGYDDEGVPAQRTELVKDGLFVGYMSSRETAAELGTVSSGAMRADGWERIPLVRMTNVNLEPGDWTLDEMIKDTERGLYLHTNKSWSIDDRRLNFQFGTEMAWLIEDGELGSLVKNATYTGITPQFWAGCDAVAGSSEWAVRGFPCGKGQPSQNGHVGHGTSPARFRNVRVGVTR